MDKRVNTNSGAKSKFSKKLLAIAVIIIVVVAVVVSWQIYRQLSTATKSKGILPALNLTLIGAIGQQKVLNSSELAALRSYTATGGYSHEGTIYVGKYTGVPILTLLDLVGGITSSENVTFTGSDGYQVTFTYQQVEGQELNTYDPTTGAAVQPSQPLTVIVAYYCNGTNLPSSTGPLTVAIVGPQGLLTPGKYWAYLLVKIEILTA
jgi:DMSO/TMAO reductase YedYZ molybdopterin-dependent catalytic subunit